MKHVPKFILKCKYINVSSISPVTLLLYALSLIFDCKYRDIFWKTCFPV